MEIIAITRMARISAFKVREVTRHIQGLTAEQAATLLQFAPQRKIAYLVGKTLKSAMANAENNNGFAPAGLIVKEAVVGEGPTLKRFQPKARGSAGPIRKRTSHIRIVLAESKQDEQNASRKVTKKKSEPKKRKQDIRINSKADQKG